MKKSFSYQNRIRSRKKERGIAIIFTLGILGLLTVIALGFASTALLNNKLAQNVSGDSYAKSLAKNLALARAIALINYCVNDFEFDYKQIYTRDSGATVKDHLGKLNTKADGVNIYSYNHSTAPSSDVTWEYVRAAIRTPSGTETTGIIGRYAYVVVPDKGRLNPNRNVGAPFNVSDSDTYTRYGKHISFPMDTGSIRSTALQDILTKSYRYTTYREAIRKAAVAPASYKEWFDDFGIGMYAPLRTREVFTHTTGSGSFQTNKYFTRFSINNSVDWENVSVADLIGESSNFNTTADADTASTFQSPNSTITYLPFLNKLWHLAGTDTARQARVRQLAANLIQYNRKLGNTVNTISDVDPATWLTSGTAPTYMGIGRHPMINEVGIAVELLPEHEKDPVAVPDTGDPTLTGAYTYYPQYKIKVTPGVELINPFYLDSPKAVEIKIIGNVKVSLQGTKPTATYNDVTAFNAPTNGHFQGSTVITHEMKLDSAFTLPIAAGTDSWDQGYTKSTTFWKETSTTDDGKNVAFEKIYNTTKNSTVLTPFTIKVPTAAANPVKAADKDLFANMKVTNIEFKIEKVLLKYDGKERDFAQLDDATLRAWDKTDYDAKHSAHVSALADGVPKPQVFFRSYQVIDPFVNLNKADWDVKDYFEGVTTHAVPVTDADRSLLYSSSKTSGGTEEQGGTLVNSAGAEKHQNRFTDAKFNTPADLNNDGTTVGLDPALVPFAFIRHAPMEHFWELACIHTGARWSTLDLTEKVAEATPEFEDYFPNFPNMTPIGTTEYAPPVPAGELFDQIKLSDNNDLFTEGLINLNTDSHAALHALFAHLRTDYRDTLTAAKTTETLPEAGTVKSTSTSFHLSCAYNSTTATPATCLVCAIQDCTKVFSFRQRSDLLIPSGDLAQAQGYNATKHANLGTRLDALQTLLKTAPNRIEKSQIIAKMMPYLRTAPVDMVYVIVLAQSIEDAGGNRTIMVDWDGTGMETAPSTAVLNRKLGLTYTDNDGNNQSITGVTLPGKIMTSNSYGTYDIGADKITGEAKIVAALVRDPESGRWRIARMHYVE